MSQAGLYLIPTPIGNLEDITLRALRMMREADIILCEDTRKTGILLKHYEIRAKLMPHHQFNEHQTIKRIVEMIDAGSTVALVTDAGTPGISDPGFLLVRACLEAGIEVTCLPGPTALIPALVNSGFPSDRFVFEGFLPHKKGRQTRFQELAREQRTIILYESPHRLVKTLEQLALHLGSERRASVSREISKIFEETRRDTLVNLVTWYNNNPPKGEIVIVIAAS